MISSTSVLSTSSNITLVLPTILMVIHPRPFPHLVVYILLLWYSSPSFHCAGWNQTRCTCAMKMDVCRMGSLQPNPTRTCCPSGLPDFLTISVSIGSQHKTLVFLALVLLPPNLGPQPFETFCVAMWPGFKSNWVLLDFSGSFLNLEEKVGGCQCHRKACRHTCTIHIYPHLLKAPLCFRFFSKRNHSTSISFDPLSILSRQRELLLGLGTWQSGSQLTWLWARGLENT